jgi:hypothetical protein
MKGSEKLKGENKDATIENRKELNRKIERKKETK